MPAIRLPVCYRPELGQHLVTLAGAAARPLWHRLGHADDELFCAIPVKYITLENQYIKDDCGSSHLNSDQSSGLPSSSTPAFIACSEAASFWRALPGLLAELPETDALDDLPFRGGLAGIIGYDASQPATAPRLDFPDAYLGLYPHFVCINHRNKTATAVSLPGFPESQARWEALIESVNCVTTPDNHINNHANGGAGKETIGRQDHDQSFHLSTPFQALTSPSQYQEHFQRIQHYLHAGDCYQVNYAQAFKAQCTGNTASAMQQLLTLSQAAHAAWLSLPEGDILSLSPELFIKTQAGRITSQPIKGTAPRSADPAADAALRQALQHSRKNQAENLMIVDLLRHDISQHAQTGSVVVEKLFEVESLPQVHHLVSTITANLKMGSQSIDLLRDCFPGGSITGAPKRRAMEIIAELEPTPRSVYCGSMGFISRHGDVDFNIAIRTLLRLGDELYTWAGGGIVADSDADAEYQECFDKIGALMRALEAMGPA